MLIDERKRIQWAFQLIRLLLSILFIVHFSRVININFVQLGLHVFVRTPAIFLYYFRIRRLFCGIILVRTFTQNISLSIGYDRIMLGIVCASPFIGVACVTVCVLLAVLRDAVV